MTRYVCLYESIDFNIISSLSDIYILLIHKNGGRMVCIEVMENGRKAFILIENKENNVVSIEIGALSPISSCYGL